MEDFRQPVIHRAAKQFPMSNNESEVKTDCTPKALPAKRRAGSAKSGDFSSAQAAPARAFWGLLDRKERWSLSWRGWLILSSLGFTAAILLLLNIHPFLAETHRVSTDILVVEGWIHEYAIRGAVAEFRGGSYRRVFTTGGPVTGRGHYVNDYQTSASVGAELLKKFGVQDEVVQMVPSRLMNRDRTYGSAVALREWLREHNMAVHSFNVITENTHARRTRLLFEKALGKNVKVGIIAVPNPDYDARHWWLYSEAVKDVVSEGVAYLYASLFFFPSEPAHTEKAARISQAHRPSA
jgi:uncharacterized SAM-binding protein YcdF (DUF218 family)